MATYKITNVGANKCLNIHGDSVTSLYNNQKVTIWSDSGSNEQKWAIDALDAGVFVRSVINNAFGLNVYRVGNPYPCDVHVISGNETDAKIDFISYGSYYKIKLTNYDLYLTASGANNGDRVVWDTASDSEYQCWTCTQTSGGTGPCNHNYISVTLNGVPLHIIETSADNIEMVNLQRRSTLSNSGYFGINGGFFNSNVPGDITCLNIATNGSNPVGPNGTGGINGLGFAAIVNDGGQLKLLEPVIETIDEIVDKCEGTLIWAQGGGNLALGDSGWTLGDLRFGPDAIANSQGRTAMVANTATNKVYLVVQRATSNKTVVGFRNAIQQYFGITSTSTDYVGILLDGGGSSALRAKNSLSATVSVDGGRPLCQIVALKDAT